MLIFIEGQIIHYLSDAFPFDHLSEAKTNAAMDLVRVLYCPLKILALTGPPLLEVTIVYSISLNNFQELYGRPLLAFTTTACTCTS